MAALGLEVIVSLIGYSIRGLGSLKGSLILNGGIRGLSVALAVILFSTLGTGIFLICSRSWLTFSGPRSECCDIT